MKTLARFTLLAAALGIILMSCERRMNPVATSIPELDQISPMQNGMSLMKAGNSIIAFQSDRSDDPEVYVMNTDGSNPIRLTYRDGHDGYPDLSPDGKKIAYESVRDGDLEIYVMNLDGTEQTCVTNSPTSDGDPDWSPDGKTILFGRLNGGVPEICTIRADGSDLKVLYVVGGTFYASPVWSPNGKKIAFQGNIEGNYEIYVMNADGTGVTNLTNNDAIDWFPTWSPNGKQIAFISRRDGGDDVYVMNADGSEPTRLTNNAGNGWSNPTWSSDGKQIVYVQAVGDKHDIFVMNADGSGQTNITNNPTSDDVAPNWGKGSLDKIDQSLIRDINFSAPGFTASVFYDNIASPDGIAPCADKKLFIVRESNTDPGSGVFLAREGSQFSPDDAYSTLGLPFNSPDDLALEGKVLYVSDGQTETVYKLSPQGGAPVPFVTSTTANTSLNPYGLAFAPPNFDGPNVDPGDLVIADNSYGNISRGVRAVNPNTGVVKVIAEGAVFADGPVTVAFSSDGTLFVFENWGISGNRSIVTLSADGTVTPFLTGIPAGSGSLAIHPKTDEIFYEQVPGEIWRIPKTGGTPQLFASNIGTFQDIEFDKQGTTLYISARGRKQVIQMCADKKAW
jgi:Tol biopolymer transport system component